MQPKTLQLQQGEQGAITATVIPEGLSITWSSSDDSVATVDNGNVTAVAAGNAIVTASITVEGITYTDTATIEVEAAPIEYQSVFNFMSDEFYNDETNWIQKLYTDETRRTYYRHEPDYAALVYDELGSASTLYVDMRIAMIDVVDWDWEPDKQYALLIRSSLSSETGDDWKLKASLTGSQENFFTAAEGSVILNSDTEETLILLTCRNNQTLPRLMTLQIGNETGPSDTNAITYLELQLVEILNRR